MQRNNMTLEQIKIEFPFLYHSVKNKPTKYYNVEEHENNLYEGIDQVSRKFWSWAKNGEVDKLIEAYKRKEFKNIDLFQNCCHGSLLLSHLANEKTRKFLHHIYKVFSDYYNTHPNSKADCFLQAVICYASVEEVKQVADKMNIDFKVRPNKISLNHAAGMGHLALVDFLLQNGVDINVNNIYGNTPLISAAMMNRTDVVSALLKRGDVDLNRTNNKGYTALVYAVFNDNVEMAKELLMRGADIMTAMPLITAACAGNLEMIKTFILHCPLDTLIKSHPWIVLEKIQEFPVRDFEVEMTLYIARRHAAQLKNGATDNENEAALRAVMDVWLNKPKAITLRDDLRHSMFGRHGSLNAHRGLLEKEASELGKIVRFGLK